jgi:hypothetical protein
VSEPLIVKEEPGLRALQTPALTVDKPRDRLAGDPASRLPARLPWSVWVGTAVSLVLTYGFLFSYVHPHVDTRICVAQLPDVLFPILPFNAAWYRVSHDLFYVVTIASLAALITQAVRGDHRALLRFSAAVSFQAVLRATTLLMLPICKATVLPGHAALEAMPTVDLGFARIPWRMWATNDLIFSGHVCEFLILTFAVWPFWPARARLALVAFQLLQATALIATRGHYTIDVIIAVPFAFFADRLTVALLAWWSTRRPAPAL